MASPYNYFEPNFAEIELSWTPASALDPEIHEPSVYAMAHKFDREDAASSLNALPYHDIQDLSTLARDPFSDIFNTTPITPQQRPPSTSLVDAKVEPTPASPIKSDPSDDLSDVEIEMVYRSDSDSDTESSDEDAGDDTMVAGEVDIGRNNDFTEECNHRNTADEVTDEGSSTESDSDDESSSDSDASISTSDDDMDVDVCTRYSSDPEAATHSIASLPAEHPIKTTDSSSPFSFTSPVSDVAPAYSSTPASSPYFPSRDASPSHHTVDTTPSRAPSSSSAIIQTRARSQYMKTKAKACTARAVREQHETSKRCVARAVSVAETAMKGGDSDYSSAEEEGDQYEPEEDGDEDYLLNKQNRRSTRKAIQKKTVIPAERAARACPQTRATAKKRTRAIYEDDEVVEVSTVQGEEDEDEAGQVEAVPSVNNGTHGRTCRCGDDVQDAVLAEGGGYPSVLCGVKGCSEELSPGSIDISYQHFLTHCSNFTAHKGTLVLCPWKDCLAQQTQEANGQAGLDGRTFRRHFVKHHLTAQFACPRCGDGLTRLSCVKEHMMRRTESCLVKWLDRLAAQVAILRQSMAQKPLKPRALKARMYNLQVQIGEARTIIKEKSGGSA